VLTNQRAQQQKGENMSAEKHRAVINRWVQEGVNEKNMGVIDEIFDPKLIHHINGEVRHGVDSFKELAGEYFSGVSDARMTIEDTVVEGDKATLRYTFSGIHTGEFVGVAPTGNPIKITGIAITRFVGDRVAETWEVNDIQGLMTQLGMELKPAE
jgi:predicted ester cyclase